MLARLASGPSFLWVMLLSLASAADVSSLSPATSSNRTTEAINNAPTRDRSPRLAREVITLGCITSLVMIFRLIINKFYSTRRAFSADDWAVFVGIFIRISATVVDAEGLIANGLGRDVWTVSTQQVRGFALYFYVIQILYFIEITIMKATWGLFYLSIFPGRIVRRILWITIGFIVLTGLVFILVAAFQCTPVRYTWEQYGNHGLHGRCIKINPVGWANAAMSVAMDFWLIAIPLNEVHKLSLHWKKKLGAAVMFMTALFVTIISIIRFRSLVTFANSKNPTWDQFELVLWSTVEVSVGMIGLCLPAIRQMLVRLAPQFFASQQIPTSSGGDTDLVPTQGTTTKQKEGQPGVKHLPDLRLSRRTWGPLVEDDWTRVV
ncbi:hypothetical protein C2857_005010 [Epichloe festucae Fl1]|uniref:Rhodopsin domain-containing protein n=1 Tax=Epichloe festucae (strain Fl1) TaxID=877507 RepID=A0A7S9KKX5_EPIFF|nr:hypothetical protein C2857_005010 [Epichloe festucae Fl1]